MFRSLLLALILLTSVIHSASAQDYVSLSAGYYDILDDADAADFRLEYRLDYDVLDIENFKPWVGIEATSDSSIWGGFGFLYDWNFAGDFYLTPNVGAGFYAQGSSDKDLGYPIEFRSQLELSYEFDKGHRFGTAFGHLSNASLDDNNPGTEVLSLYWHIPM